MQPDESLPPVRELARTLKVSPATVAAAYRLLRTRGLTSAHGRRGTRVVARPHARSRQPIARVPDGAVDLASGNPDPELLPSLDAAVRSLDLTPRMYDDSPHLTSLIQFVADELRGDGVPAGKVVITSGAFDAIERVLREHLRPGDAVALEDPCVPFVNDLLVACGYLPVPFAIDDHGPVPQSLVDALDRACRAVVITARAQNPLGAAVTSERAADLRVLLRRYPDLLLIEDDPAGPVAGVPLATLCDSTRHRWAHVRSTGKSLGPDLRVAFVTGDPLTMDRVAGRHALGPRRVSLLLQQMVLALWSDPSAARQLVRASDIYRQRRTSFVDALAARGIPAMGASGFNVWVPVSQEVQIVQELAAHGWAVAAGEPFRLRAAPGIRVTTATLAPADSSRFADTLAGVITSSMRPSA